MEADPKCMINGTVSQLERVGNKELEIKEVEGKVDRKRGINTVKTEAREGRSNKGAKEKTSMSKRKEKKTRGGAGGCHRP